MKNLIFTGQEGRGDTKITYQMSLSELRLRWIVKKDKLRRVKKDKKFLSHDRLRPKGTPHIKEVSDIFC